MLANLNGWHAIIVLAVILLLFGAAKLPQLAKSVGQSMKIFKSEIKTSDTGATATTSSADPIQYPAPSTPSPGSTETPPKL